MRDKEALKKRLAEIFAEADKYNISRKQIGEIMYGKGYSWIYRIKSPTFSTVQKIDEIVEGLKKNVKKVKKTIYIIEKV